MGVFFCIITVIAIVGFFMSLNSPKASKTSVEVDSQAQERYVRAWERFDAHQSTEKKTSTSQLYWEYPIVGMKYRRMSDYELESFYCGTLKHDKKNRHDDLAIGVYNENGRCVGYIPVPDNEEVYDAMQEAGLDEVDVIGSIEKSYESGYKVWIGRVYIKKEILNLPES